MDKVRQILSLHFFSEPLQVCYNKQTCINLQAYCCL